MTAPSTTSPAAAPPAFGSPAPTPAVSTPPASTLPASTLPASTLPVSTLPASPVAARILTAASRLFYADGIRAVSADRVIAEAGISKVTFYRHYPTKDALVVAYLSAVSQAERAAVAAARAQHPEDPAAVLRGYAGRIGRESCAPGFRGCAFINAAAEYADADHPVRTVVAEHRAWLAGTAAELLTDLGVDDPAGAAAELVMLRDGAMVAGYVGSPEVVAAALDRAGAAIVAGHRAPGAVEHRAPSAVEHRGSSAVEHRGSTTTTGQSDPGTPVPEAATGASTDA